MVVFWLGVKYFEVGKRDDMGFDVVFFGEEFDGVNGNVDFGIGGDKGDVGIFLFVEDVVIFDCFFDGGVF